MVESDDVTTLAVDVTRLVVEAERAVFPDSSGNCACCGC